nr:uncharacterized protein LOC114924749 [Arachis hypogaea]
MAIPEITLNLLSNGFRLLKVGGSLVYRTCSLTLAQNEDVVEHFLKENVNAGRILMPLCVKHQPYITNNLMIFLAVLTCILFLFFWSSVINMVYDTILYCHPNQTNPKGQCLEWWWLFTYAIYNIFAFIVGRDRWCQKLALQKWWDTKNMAI